MNKNSHHIFADNCKESAELGKIEIKIELWCRVMLTLRLLKSVDASKNVPTMKFNAQKHVNIS